MWAWLPERWSGMCVRERKLPINYNKHDHQQYHCIYFAASSAYKFQKNKVHLTLNTNLADVAILNQRVLLQTLALETASVWIIIRMIRCAMTNDTEHRSHLSGSNAEQITWFGWSGASRLQCRMCPVRAILDHLFQVSYFAQFGSCRPNNADISCRQTGTHILEFWSTLVVSWHCMSMLRLPNCIARIWNPVYRAFQKWY